MRWFALIATLAGALLGVAFLSGVLGGTGYTFSVAMTPPTGSSGESPLLTCGWHGECPPTPTAGIALDWDNTATTSNVYFRGYFYRSNSPFESTRLWGQPIEVQKGSDRCDIMAVWILERYNGALRAVPKYTHINLSSTAAFNIATWGGGGTGWYNNRRIGYMVDDSGGCRFGGTHAHEYHQADETWDSTPNVTETLHTSLYPALDYCPGGVGCTAYKNNDLNNWTRWFVWEEGS